MLKGEKFDAFALRSKFLHLATDFLNKNNSDITGKMSFLSDKHS